jgi:hypothetical protein
MKERRKKYMKHPIKEKCELLIYSLLDYLKTRTLMHCSLFYRASISTIPPCLPSKIITETLNKLLENSFPFHSACPYFKNLFSHPG